MSSGNRLAGLHTFPTDGNPMSATLASPDFCTSKPVPPPLDFPTGSRSWARYRANLAFNKPRWYSVAWGVELQLALAKQPEPSAPCFFALQVIGQICQ